MAGTRNSLWARNETADIMWVVAAVALIGTSVCNLAYGLQQGTSESFVGPVTLQHINGCLFLAVEIAAAKFLHGAWKLYRAKFWVPFLIVFALGGYFSLLALTNTVGFLGMEKAKVVAALDHDAGGYAHRKAEVERIDKQLKWVPEGRTAEQIAADIDLKERDDAYTRTQGCKPEAITLKESRTFCNQYVVLDAERKSANARARLTKELKEAQSKLDGTKPVVAADSFAVSVKDFFGVQEEQTVRYKPLAMAVGAWLLAMFGFAASDMVRASGRVQSPSGSVPVIEVVRPAESVAVPAPTILAATSPEEDATYLEAEKPLETAIGHPLDTPGQNVTAYLPRPVTALQAVDEWVRQTSVEPRSFEEHKGEYVAYAKRRNAPLIPRLHQLGTVVKSLGHQFVKGKGGKTYVVSPKVLASQPRVAVG